MEEASDLVIVNRRSHDESKRYTCCRQSDCRDFCHCVNRVQGPARKYGLFEMAFTFVSVATVFSKRLILVTVDFYL